MGFLNSYIGQWVFQCIVHSIVALFIVEQAIRVWVVKSPIGRFRYRLLVLLLPFLIYPVSHFLTPERGGFFFRKETAIFDGLEWLGLRLGKVPVGLIVFYLGTSLTSIIMVLQEIVPILRGYMEGKNPSLSPAPKWIKEAAEEILKDTGLHMSKVFIVTDEQPIIYTSGSKSIVLSEGLLSVLSPEQIRTALAHEAAHIIRRSNLTTFFIFLLRVMMFFNPVSLIIFRRILEDDEQVCDDITVALTGKPSALASALRVFYSSPKEVVGLKESIERASHNLRLTERIERLENLEIGSDSGFNWLYYIMTASAIVLVNYFVV